MDKKGQWSKTKIWRKFGWTDQLTAGLLNERRTDRSTCTKASEIYSLSLSVVEWTHREIEFAQDFNREMKKNLCFLFFIPYLFFLLFSSYISSHFLFHFRSSNSHSYNGANLRNQHEKSENPKFALMRKLNVKVDHLYIYIYI